MFLEHDDATVLFVENQLPSSLSHYLTLDEQFFTAEPEELKNLTPHVKFTIGSYVINIRAVNVKHV